MGTLASQLDIMSKGTHQQGISNGRQHQSARRHHLQVPPRHLQHAECLARRRCHLHRRAGTQTSLMSSPDCCSTDVARLSLRQSICSTQIVSPMGAATCAGGVSQTSLSAALIAAAQTESLDLAFFSASAARRRLCLLLQQPALQHCHHTLACRTLDIATGHEQTPEGTRVAQSKGPLSPGGCPPPQHVHWQRARSWR